MKKLRIMIVEDDYSYADLLQTVLQSMGHEASISMGGRVCLALVPSQRPDLIILDLAMPDLDGIEVLRLLKNNGLTKDIPVIMNSIGRLPVDRATAVGHGAATFIPKTLKRDVLNEALAGALSGAAVPA